ncbi:MAG: hypothetical protein IH846_17620 [Acidobacteria bacterium]|nr:hypothetical protein [Acidobacteriota bacterium]
MGNFTIKAIFLGLAVMTAGCLHPIRNTNNRMQGWVGHHESELIQSWGPPTETADDGAGGKILIYRYEKSYTTPGKAVTRTKTTPSVICARGPGIQPCNDVGSTSTSTTVITPPKTRTYVQSRMFYVNKKGYVYSWRWRGL